MSNTQMFTANLMNQAPTSSKALINQIRMGIVERELVLAFGRPELLIRTEKFDR